MKLYDGDNEIKRIHVLGMFRSNEKYLTTFFIKTMNELEEMYDGVHFTYYFIENNSVDNTKDVLKSFIQDKEKSKLVLFNMKKDYKNIGDGRNYNRISSLAKVRNKLVNNCVPFPENEWCLFIDSNIYFSASVLKDVFETCPKPSEDNIGMMCMYTQQLMIPEIHTQSKTPVLVKHFYDTFSLYNKDGHTFYPNCAFEKCMICSKKPIKNGYTRIPMEPDIVDISSGFAGFVFIKSDILNNPNIRWSTLCYNQENDQSLCEHVLFCERLRSVSNQRIVLLQNIDTLYRTI